jgi:hypothetical protein
VLLKCPTPAETHSLGNETMSLRTRFLEDLGGSSMTNMKFYLMVALGFVLTFGYVSGRRHPETAAQANTVTEPYNGPLPDPSLSSICAAAQIYIEDRLKSPGSGSFDICQILSVSADKRTVVITGNVTATNAFNAKIRSPYAATVVRRPGAPPNEDNFETWRVASLQIN